MSNLGDKLLNKDLFIQNEYFLNSITNMLKTGPLYKNNIFTTKDKVA